MKRKNSKVSKKRHKTLKNTFTIEDNISISSEDDNSCVEVTTNNVSLSYEQFKIKNEEVDLSDQEFVISDDDSLNNEEVIVNDHEGINEEVINNDDGDSNNEEVINNDDEDSNNEDVICNGNLSDQNSILLSILSTDEPTKCKILKRFVGSHEMYKFIWRTYLIATRLKTSKVYLNHLHKEFSKKYPKVKATKTTLAEICRAMNRNKLLSKEDLDEIKEEVTVYLAEHKKFKVIQTYPVALFHTPSNRINREENVAQKIITRIWTEGNNKGEDERKTNEEIVSLDEADDETVFYEENNSRNNVAAYAENLRNDINVYVENLRNGVNVISSDEETLSGDEVFEPTNDINSVTNVTTSNITNNTISNITDNTTSNILNNTSNIKCNQPFSFLLVYVNDTIDAANPTMATLPMVYPFNMNQPSNLNSEVIDMTTEKNEEPKKIEICKKTATEKLGDSFYDCDFEDMLDNLNGNSNILLHKSVRENMEAVNRRLKQMKQEDRLL